MLEPRVNLPSYKVLRPHWLSSRRQGTYLQQVESSKDILVSLINAQRL